MSQMFLALLHTIQRLLVLMLGLGLVYVTVFFMFPYFNEKLPLALALLVVYCLLAYLAIPILLRINHVLLKPDHIPMYAITPDGWPSDPVNIAIIASNKRHLIKAMKEAGWYTADKLNIKNALRSGWAIIFNKPYPNAPFSALYLFGRPFDVGFQIPRNKKTLSPRTRHHVRFWRLKRPGDKQHRSHYDYWKERLQHLFDTTNQVWIGAAIDDNFPFGIHWRDARITHRTNPNTDDERDFIIKTLIDSDLVENTKTVQAGEPFTFRGQQLHHRFICDGNIRVVTLTSQDISK